MASKRKQPDSGIDAETPEKKAKAAGPASASSSNGTDNKAATPAVPTEFKRSAAYVEAEQKNQKGLKRLTTEFKRALSCTDFSASLVDNDLFHWEIKLPFDESSVLGKELRQLAKTDSVFIRMQFDTTHPFKPPLVRVRTPRFLTGSTYVMQGGAICMDTFSQGFWSPAMTAEKSIIAIQSLLLTPNLVARLDPVNYAKEYTEAEAKASFETIKQAHADWNLPQAAAAAAAAPAARAPVKAKGRSRKKS